MNTNNYKQKKGNRMDSNLRFGLAATAAAAACGIRVGIGNLRARLCEKDDKILAEVGRDEWRLFPL